MCELVPAFVIRNVDAIQSNKIENLEKYVVREYVDTRVVGYSLKKNR